MPPAKPTPSTTDLVVTAEGLNVRDAPSLQGEVVGILDKGQVVDWIDSSGDEYWRKVEKGTVKGWASHKYLTPVLANQPAAGHPWLAIAYAELGVKEVTGSGDNPRIVEYLHATNLSAPYRNNDETAWCSGFANWCVERAGFAGTDSAAAISWGLWGKATTDPAAGDVVVFNWGNGHGHVGFFVGFSGTSVQVLGGNQSDAVTVKNWPRAKVWRYRKPA
jgi:uncharacterized protein (TIGR02594 family)